MPNPKQPFPREFREEAVRIYPESGRSLKSVCTDLGISLETLRKWVNQAQVDAGTRAGLTTEERAELTRLRRENRTLRMDRDLLERAAAFFAKESETGPRRGRTSRCAWRVGTSGSPRRRSTTGAGDPLPSGARRPRAYEARAGDPRRSRGTYGAPRITAELRLDHGILVSRKRVARLMRTARIQGAHVRRRWRRRGRPELGPAPDLVGRRFNAEAPDRIWVADITYIPTAEGWLHLAAVMDLHSRAVVGWAMAPHLRSELVIDALEMAISGVDRPRDSYNTRTKGHSSLRSRSDAG